MLEGDLNCKTVIFKQIYQINHVNVEALTAGRMIP